MANNKKVNNFSLNLVGIQAILSNHGWVYYFDQVLQLLSVNFSLIAKISGAVHVCTKVRLENDWNSKQMITEGDAAIPLETTRLAFRNQEKSKQRSAITGFQLSFCFHIVGFSELFSMKSIKN